MERILCAATWFSDLKTPHHGVDNILTGIVLCGHNHAQILHQLLALTGKKQHEAGGYTQGFLTNRNRFVTRKEGAIIWQNQGGKLNYHSDQLFSEDVNK